MIAVQCAPLSPDQYQVPAALLMPVGFGAMFLQGVAEIIKRIAHLSGAIQMDTHYEKPVQ